ncbi:MAG: hypothetical protein AAF799_09240 [Myxococcota bacterium]
MTVLRSTALTLRYGALGAGLLVVGCASEPSPNPAQTGSTGDTDAIASSSDGAEETLDPGIQPPSERLDVPQDDEELGCRKIDFLFVIDDSHSMADEQQLLIDGFPGFMEEIRETIVDFDFHVMVVGTGAQEMSFDPCENRLGAGRVRSAEGEDCGLLEDFLNGQRYLDDSHEDLAGAFSCIADLGTDGGGDEKIAWAMADAISRRIHPGECNEGFLRDDAILVITIITDEEDNPHDGPPIGDFDNNSPGHPELWVNGVLEAKHGDDEAVVMLALIGDSEFSDGVCAPYQYPDGDGAEPAPRIRQMVESFPYGSWSSVCQSDYAGFFNQAVGDIDAACGGFQPPG